MIVIRKSFKMTEEKWKTWIKLKQNIKNPIAQTVGE